MSGATTAGAIGRKGETVGEGPGGKYVTVMKLSQPPLLPRGGGGGGGVVRSGIKTL